MKIKFTHVNVLYLAIILFSGNICAQNYSTSNIKSQLKKLNVLGSVLYIAAHPDDENTNVISYFSKGKLLRTGYMSMTRGDGGQNLLGSGKGDVLGVIRTNELMGARKIDGGQQFFSRAIDFGYSKSAKETLKKWDREKVLYDIVKVIRQFRPDIIITRFSKTQGGHGHHLASAILAEEAFRSAGDESKFQDQLDSLIIWKPKRIFWNTWQPSDRAIKVNVGGYNPLLGSSYPEFAAKSRSMHKSQGFGVSAVLGERIEKFDLIAGDSAKNDLFEGIDISWGRINQQKIALSIEKIIKEFDDENPSASVKGLIDLYKTLDDIEDDFWKEIKKREIKRLIQLCLGLHFESDTWNEGAFPNSKVIVRPSIINRSEINLVLQSISTTFEKEVLKINSQLEYDAPLTFKQEIHIPSDAKYSQPYWLEKNHSGNMFEVEDFSNIGKAINNPSLVTKFNLKIYGEEISFTVPVKYKWNDSLEGEKSKILQIEPKISVSFSQDVYVIPNNNSKEIKVILESKADNLSGKLKLELPKFWKADKNFIDIKFDKKNEKQSFLFRISPNKNTMLGEIRAEVIIDNKIYNHKIIDLNYNHIPSQIILQVAKAKLVNLNVKVIPKRIAYIMGSGDDIPFELRQLGYNVKLLSDGDLDTINYQDFDVVICGVRAFNTRDNLEVQQVRILDFVKNGGTWIVQHNTRFGKQVNQIGPYPFVAKGKSRISEEDAELEILNKDHQIFNYPNKITQDDFKGWVQERGTYLAESWEGKLYPLISGHDEGESSQLGGLLYSNYGNGVFIYTALSWFRQLPAGVPGAYRLFVNILSSEGSK